MASDILFSGGYSWVSGPNGWNAVQLDGAIGSGGIIAAGTPINVFGANFTLAYWMRLDNNVNSKYLWSKEYPAHGGSDFAHINGFATSGVSNLYTPSSGVYNVYTIPDTNWHFYLWTYNGSNVVLYVDNSVKATIGALTSDSGGDAYLGCETLVTVNAEVSFSQMRMYTSVLGSTDRTTLYNAGEVTTDQIGRWKFSEGTGATVAQDAGSSPPASPSNASQMIRRQRLARSF